MNATLNINSFGTFLLTFFLISVLFMPSSKLHAQRTSSIHHELGLWLGATSPVPGTRVSGVIDSNIGAGAFYRVNAPWVFYTELGFSYANYFSRTTQQLILAPVYAALAYPIPLPIRMQTFVKAGGGSAYLEVRPQNKSGWDPMLYAGLEFSTLAGRRIRLGLRFDYFYIIESGLKNPQDRDLTYSLMYVTANRGGVSSYYTDPRFRRNNFKVSNGSFYDFGIMMGFVF